MKAFLFPLQKALDLRARQLALDEAKFQAAAASVAQADREREILLQARQAAEAQVRRAGGVRGEELSALEWFRKRARAEEQRIAHVRAQRVQTLEQQRDAMLEARRRVRLLERLKESRYAEWSSQAAEEIEETAI
jgi:hypothetical protein